MRNRAPSSVKCSTWIRMTTIRRRMKVKRMTTLDLILSRVVLQTDALRDRVTGGAEQVLGKRKSTPSKDNIGR